MKAGEPREHSRNIPTAKPVVPIAKPIEPTPVFVNQVVGVHTLWHAIAGWVLFIACFTVVIIIFRPVAASLGLSSLGQYIFGFSCAIVASLILAIVPWIQRIRTRRRVRAIFAKNPMMPLDELAATVQRKRCRLSGHAGTKEMVLLLSQAGRHNETARFCRLLVMHPIQPLHVEFEPRLLDETDSGFRELADSTGSSGAPSGLLSGQDTQLLRRIRRNTHLKGGSLSLSIYIVFLGLAVLESIGTGRITFWLMFWVVMVSMSLLSPATAGVFANKWHVLPGGIFVQLATNPNKLKWHAFSRAESVLAVHQLTRHKWIILVSDSLMPLEILATTEEVHMLLRAWLSPLPMPSRERLAGLAE